MFAMNNTLATPISLQADGMRALNQYRWARLRGWLGQRRAALTGRSRDLCELAQVARQTGASQRHFAGIQTVPVRQIRGTEGRSRDFDADFNPLTDHTMRRWLNVFSIWQRGVALPPIELTYAGDTYFVRDGHHRVSVARALGQEFVEALVTVWQ